MLGYLSDDQLTNLVLPIGELTKGEVRSEAERLGLRTWDKPDSQDVCFIEASKGREGFLVNALDFTRATIVDSGDRRGARRDRRRRTDDGRPAPRRCARA